MNRPVFLALLLLNAFQGWAQFPDWIKGADYLLVYACNEAAFDTVDVRRTERNLYAKHRHAMDSTFQVGIGRVVWGNRITLEIWKKDVRYRLGYHSDHLFQLGQRETVESPFGNYTVRYPAEGMLSNGMPYYKIKIRYHGVLSKKHHVMLYFSPEIGVVYLKYVGKDAPFGGNEVVLQSVNGLRITF
jgi:hypothetical protein